MPTLTTIVCTRTGIVAAISEQVIAGQALAGGGVVVSADESSDLGIVIAALEVIQFCLLVANIATEAILGVRG